MTTKARVALGVAAFLVAGCGGGGGADSSGSAGSPSPASRTSADSPLESSSPAASCANPEGGRCVNGLTPGQDYTTTLFEPNITYSVPEAGWANDEDLPGNFLLLPPGNDLQGVNAATSDFIGVYTSITASTFSDLDGCVTTPLAKVPRTAHGFVRWMQSQAVLDVSKPEAISMDGLRGLETDVRVAPGQTPPTCTLGPDKITVALLFSGLEPSSLDHGVVAGMTMRLYLLQRGKQLMAIEVDDIDAAPGDLESLSAEVRRLRFDT